MRMWFRVFLMMLVGLAVGCGKDKGGAPGQPQPVPLPAPGTPGGGTATPTPAGSESFDVLESTFRDSAGWQVDSTGAGRQGYNPAAPGLELSVRSPFEADPGHCQAASVTLTQSGLLKDAKEATIDLELGAQPLPKNLEYQLRLQAYVGPGRRLISFTPRGVRSFNTDASFLVSPQTLTPGDHDVRLVANDVLTALYLDGKKLGAFQKGYLPGGANPGDLVIELEAFDKAPARNSGDCASDPARVTLKKLRVASKAYFLP